MPTFPAYGSSYTDIGNVLTAPVVPERTFSGGSVLKVAAAVGIFAFIFLKLGTSGGGGRPSPRFRPSPAADEE